ncbi:MAG: efflux RND transporter periplasmic adaptor subunit [Gemmatimonadaceae bacterium]|nr:efflux RND transporter periplasmic adaptor subunit [Gemmatimonadaceae bacterium]
MTMLVSRNSRALRATGSALLLATIVGACAGSADATHDTGPNATPRSASGTPLVIADTTLTSMFDAAGVAEPLQVATLSTKVMGNVTAVLAQEGQMVGAGAVLVTIDARDLAAKGLQVDAAIADAEAMHAEAATNAARFTALYNDSAATRAQYDAARTALARAESGVRTARAGAEELKAVRGYATVRAPFAGMVTVRMADVGTFAAPGAPLLMLQDISALRLSAQVPSDVTRLLRAGQRVSASIDGDSATATIEGIVPAGPGGLFTVNARLANRPLSNGQLAYRAGSAATLHLPHGTRRAIVIPQQALVRDGDLVGVTVRAGGATDRRWVRVGLTQGGQVEITSGLVAGDTILVPLRESGS